MTDTMRRPFLFILKRSLNSERSRAACVRAPFIPTFPYFRRSLIRHNPSEHHLVKNTGGGPLEVTRRPSFDSDKVLIIGIFLLHIFFFWKYVLLTTLTTKHLTSEHCIPLQWAMFEQREGSGTESLLDLKSRSFHEILVSSGRIAVARI